MGCNCRGGNAKTYTVKLADGSTRGPYLSQQEAKVIAASYPGASVITK